MIIKLGWIFLQFFKIFLDRSTNRWNGHASIPLDYFPPNFDHFNAYAIHNQQIDGQEPIYKALYPSSAEEPDFHDLGSFEVFSGLPTIQTTTTLSDVWSKALSLRTYTISNLWNGRDDTFSKADDKGGNQIMVSLKGMILKTFY